MGYKKRRTGGLPYCLVRLRGGTRDARKLDKNSVGGKSVIWNPQEVKDR